MIRAAQQIGWQHAVPETPRGATRETRTRGEIIVQDGGSLPDYDGIERADLLTALQIMHWAEPMPMGGWLPLRWSDVYSFGRATGRLTNAWEYETMCQMSAAYASGRNDTALLSIPPVERD